MTTPSAQLAPANAADWPWLQSAIDMASLASETWSAGVGQSRIRPRALPKVATRTPAMTPQSVTTARAFTLRTMLRWGAADRSHDVAGVVSELLTNAFRHAVQQPIDMPWPEEPGRVRLGLLSVGYIVLCAVADPSRQAPVLRQPDWLDESGRGLHLVDSLSDDWGFCAVAHHPGKVVWATFTTTSCPQPDLDLGPD
jgi:anti-sigma regulatory factor (Ser/Thr protein kinase)